MKCSMRTLILTSRVVHWDTSMLIRWLRHFIGHRSTMKSLHMILLRFRYDMQAVSGEPGHLNSRQRCIMDQKPVVIMEDELVHEIQPDGSISWCRDASCPCR